jgi:hemerythrin-like domain-containing protein
MLRTTARPALTDVKRRTAAVDARYNASEAKAMLELIGDREAASFDDPVGMLRACHGRIERQLVTLERLARHLPIHGADDNARSAARGLLRYFDNAAPHHHADEEASVFPRLLARTSEARELVARLGAQHEHLDACWRKLRPLMSGIASGQRANLPPALALEFAQRYGEHVAHENEALLPLCGERLTRNDLDAIGAEMAARRGVPWQRPASPLRSQITRE